MGASEMFKAVCWVLDSTLNGPSKITMKEVAFQKTINKLSAIHTFKYIPLHTELLKIRDCLFHLCVSPRPSTGLAQVQGSGSICRM